LSDLIEILRQTQGLMIVPLVLLVGLLGSSHCLVMCVPIASGLTKDSLRFYHFGKLLAYFFVGTSIFYFSKTFLQSEVIKFVAGLLFLSYLLLSLFKDFNHKACLSIHKKSQSAFILGLLNGLLPCAWLYLVFLNLSLQVEVLAFLALVFVFWVSTLPIYQILKVKYVSLRLFPIFKSKLIRLGLMVILTLGSFVLHFPATNTTRGSSPEPLNCYAHDLLKAVK
jgi:sulfite exporter TauE/SafE